MEISAHIFWYTFLPIVVLSQISLVFYLLASACCNTKWTSVLKFVERTSTGATEEEEQKLDMANILRKVWITIHSIHLTINKGRSCSATHFLEDLLPKICLSFYFINILSFILMKCQPKVHIESML